jgi:TolB-like protein/Tfp pilus assembly protein PilF
MTDLVAHLRDGLAGRYAIESELGRGGMAIVFLAEDLKHNRKVAIKVLKPELARALGAERFLREIETAARLNHPNILPVHDSGEGNGLLYYVMPYVEEDSLRNRIDREKQLPLEEALGIIREVADALDYAHAQGLVHRDIKPENILFQAGHAVVSDFGIAQAVSQAGGERLTETGLAMGTPAYMSPEQAAGEPNLDARADVYGLGCVLYEMLAGSPPYVGATPQAVLARKAVEPVPSIRVVRDTVPQALEETLVRALAKVRADRYRTTGEFAAALQRSLSEVPAGTRRGRKPRPTARPRPGPATRRRALAIAAVAIIVAAAGWWASRLVPEAGAASVTSIAVLPPQNLSGEAGQEYFIEGMHDALIGQLARIGSLRVISRTSTMRYRVSDKTVPEIARELGVDGIIEASIARDGDSVHMQVQLIQAVPEERYLWTDSYDREVGKALAMHADVARAIAQELEIALSPDQEADLAGVSDVDPATYEAYLRGMFSLSKFTPEGIAEGLEHLHGAVESDPGDPLAWAGLAQAYATLGHGPAPPPDAWPRARAAAERALRLDPSLAEAHAAMADIKLYYEWDWAGAESEFIRANELNPSQAWNHFHYAWYLGLMGRLDEAIQEHLIARELDPLSPPQLAILGWLYLYAGDYHRARYEARQALDLSPDDSFGLATMGAAYMLEGEHDKAIEYHERMVAANPRWRWLLGRSYAEAGRIDEARAILAELEAEEPTSWNAIGLVVLNTALGEIDAAFRWMDYEQPHAWVPWLTIDPVLIAPRDDPRFDEFLERLNLPG